MCSVYCLQRTEIACFGKYSKISNCLANMDDLALSARRVPTAPGKPGKMTVAFPVMEISWNLKNYEKYHGKMRGNLEK